MIVSNEPGYYEDGQFGIRIENLLVGPDYKPVHCCEHTSNFKMSHMDHVQVKALLPLPSSRSASATQHGMAMMIRKAQACRCARRSRPPSALLACHL